MNRLRISTLHAAAPSRLPGYIEDALRSGVVEGEFITFDAATFARLRATYSLKPPTLASMLANFRASMRDWIAAGLPVVDGEEFHAREQVCAQCPQRGDVLGVMQCKACGCTGLKLWLETEHCPLGKW